jgi:hypothetical protein
MKVLSPSHFPVLSYNERMAHAGDIYSVSRAKVLERFGDRIDCPGQALGLALFTEVLEEPARIALANSFRALGYRNEDCAFAKVENLEPKEAFALMEGLDPLFLLATDAEAARICARAVRQPFPLMRAVRLFGREARAFPRLNGQLETESNKQAVWHLLKSLPHG